MIFLNRNKIFNRYLPMFLSVVLLCAIFVGYFVIKQSSPAQAGWYATGGTWAYRKPIVIDHTKVNTATGTTTPLSNFTVLINITDSSLKNNASSTGADILFTSSDGLSKLNYERETYSSSTGNLIAWVQIPSLPSTNDTIVYMYFGNSSATDQQSVNSTWDTNYKGVWHLNQAVANPFTDSTSNSLNGIATGTGLSSAAGKIGNALGSTGATGSGFVSVPSSVYGGGGQLTESIWVKTTGLNNNAQSLFLYKLNYGANTGYALIDNGQYSASEYFFVGNVSPSPIARSVVNDGNWHYLTGTYATGTNGSKLYLDGVFQSSTTISPDSVADTADILTIGQYQGNGGAGYTDEARISNIARSADWIKTEYLNQNSPGTFASLGGIQTPKAGVAISSRGVSSLGWYATGGTWTNRRAIVIDHTKISNVATTSYSSFPMLFSTTDTEFKYTGFSGGKVASSTGADILFTSSDGLTKLNYERESYSSSTGNLIAWVQIPLLSATTDTTLYMYYGNPSAADQQNASSTWDSNYQGVWHLGDVPATAKDSKGIHNGVISGSSGISGQIDGGATFSHGSYLSNTYTNGDYISTGITDLTFGGANAGTIEFWANPQFSPTDGNAYQMAGQNTGSGNEFSFWKYSDNNFYMGWWSTFEDDRVALAANSVNFPQNQWTHIVIVWASGTKARLYLNGSLAGTATNNTTLSNLNQSFGIGSQLVTSGSNSSFLGYEDEFRISNFGRSADWIKTEYNNQYSPQTFYSLSGSNIKTRSAGVPFLKSRGRVKFH
jgi:hypothetical protein